MIDSCCKERVYVFSVPLLGVLGPGVVRGMIYLIFCPFNSGTRSSILSSAESERALFWKMDEKQKLLFVGLLGHS